MSWWGSHEVKHFFPQQGSGGFRRFRRVPVQIPGEVLEGSGSGGFRCRYLLRFRRVSVQIAGEVPEGSGADTVLRFRRVPG